MKIRNKKTGEIVDLTYVGSLKAQFGGISVIPDTAKIEGHEYFYDSLESLTDEWEDASEPEGLKDFWYINDFMIICGTEGEFTTPDLATFTKEDIEKLKAIGNYFDSEEEAKRAVEKLKALKRLRDKGFRFTGYSEKDREYINQIKIYAETDGNGKAIDLAEDPDVKLIFGDEG